MLVSFVVDPEALQPHGAGDWRDLESHERCIRHGLQYGILVYDGGSFSASELWRAVDELPQQLRTAWMMAFKRLRKRQGPKGWHGLRTVESPDGFRVLGQDVQVACLEETRAGIVGVPDDKCQYRILPDGPEVVRMPSIDQALCFKEAEKLSSEPIAKGTKVVELWKSRFRDLAALSVNVVVVDRYAVCNLEWHQDGLSRFLKELDGTARRCKVTLLSADIKECGKNAESYLREIGLGRGGIREIEVHIISDEVFKRWAHDRFIRFDEGVCEIGDGVAVFGGSDVSRLSSFSFKPKHREHLEVEKRLKTSRGSQRFRIVVS